MENIFPDILFLKSGFLLPATKKTERPSKVDKLAGKVRQTPKTRFNSAGRVKKLIVEAAGREGNQGMAIGFGWQGKRRFRLFCA